MFERYTERARRAIFFARYEASQYGNQCIESEHLLLGLLREDRALGKWFPERINIGEIRAEIEKRITRRECIPTNVKVPLAAECKKILTLAAESAETLGHRPVVEETLADTRALFVANALWKNAFLVSVRRIWMHRMTVVLSPEKGEWRIVS